MKNSCSISVARVALVLLLLSAIGTATKAADPCDVSNLPQQIQTTLAKNYPDWQPEKLEDLYEEDRPLWTKAHPNECPGIAIGHFESKTEISYALLLISKPGRNRLGYRVIVFSRVGPSASLVAHVATKWNIGSYDKGSDEAISAVPPGRYEEAIGSKQAQIELDSIMCETFGKGAAVYYWKNGRYRELITSE